jgi:phosphoserine aminotransferase
VTRCPDASAPIRASVGRAQKLNEEKAGILYDAIAASNGFYNSPVDPAVRSLMNVPFTIPSSPDLEKAFIKEAEKLGMVSCRGG